MIISLYNALAVISIEKMDYNSPLFERIILINLEEFNFYVEQVFKKLK